MKDDFFTDLIIKFLDGVATPHEKRMLGNWLEEDPARHEIFYLYLSMRESENPQHFPEMDLKVEAYEKFLDGTVQRPPLDFEHYRERPQGSAHPKNYFWWLAASVLLLVSFSIYFFQESFFYRTYAAEDGTIKSVVLEDGTTVTLNANSSIRVLRDFMAHESREVWIDGEAFFEVTRKSSLMKFIVHTDNFDVEVLGTKFNVNNRRAKSEVILAEGKVKILAKDHEPLIMNPGEQVSLSNEQKHLERQLVKPEKYEAWQNNLLVFENTPLSEVALIIKDYYGVNVTITDSLLAARQFTGTLPNNDLKIILDALSTAYRIEINQRQNHIVLK